MQPVPLDHGSDGREAGTVRRRRNSIAELVNPAIARELRGRWSLELGEPYSGDDISASWVAPAARPGLGPAVLKVGVPHMEAEHEIQGLRFWNGNPTVYLLEADEQLNAMLLERCEPGTSLRSLPEPEQDKVIANLLRRMWRKPEEPNPFRPLAAMLGHWSAETLDAIEEWPDAGLVREGLQLFEELPRTAPEEVLLATDLHAGNVLRAQREPWLVIDPKPFRGDPSYDATQHLLNCRERLLADADGLIRAMADLLEVDHQRVRLWTFARAAAEPREDWSDEVLPAIARAV